MIGMNVQRLADQKSCFRGRVGGAVSEDELGLRQALRGGTDERGDGGQLRPSLDRLAARHVGFAPLQRRSTTGVFSAARSSVTNFTGLTVTNVLILSSTTRPRRCEALRSSNSPLLPNATRPV